MMLPIGCLSIAMTSEHNEGRLPPLGTALLLAICLLRQYWRYCYLDFWYASQRLVWRALFVDTQGIEVGFAQWIAAGAAGCCCDAYC